ncbi:hypothetical protein PspTeo4_25384 [Pseudomonas sp. Teo4]|nr:hypothetical protein [Pseudomonas sp. Teo4]
MARVRWNFEGKLGACLVLGMINSGIPATFYSVAAQVLPAGYSAIFNATTPLMGVLIGALCFREPMTLPKLCGIFLGLFGVGILSGAGPVALDLALLQGAWHAWRPPPAMALPASWHDAGSAGWTAASRRWAACLAPP